MEPWILVTLGAAVAQTIRFTLQKSLAAGRLSAAGATFARFVYSAPLVAVAVVLYARASAQPLPSPPAAFWPWAAAGGTTQILATVAVVLLFGRRNFAVGITFKKTEVLLSALAGALLLGEGVSAPALAAMAVGMGGVLMLSDPPGGQGAWLRRIASPSAALGLLSGACFAVSGVGYRAAALSLPSGDALLRALVTLAWVTAYQTLALGAWLLWRERGEIARVFAAWRLAGLVGLFSMAETISEKISSTWPIALT